MGKTIDELTGLDDTPFDEAPDPRPTAWGRFVRDIEDLLDTGQYTWAEDTLRGIQATVEKTERVTEGQRQAVAHIETAKRSRRWEGYGRRLR
jgi:hypothetical protein